MYMVSTHLDHLGKLSQGLTISRYENPSGTAEKVVHARNLDALYIDSELSTVTLALDQGTKERYKLLENDVVLTIRGMSPKASVVGPTIQSALLGPNLARVRPDLAQINPVYLAGLFGSEWLQQSLTKVYGQSTGTQLFTLKQLRQLSIPVPSLDVQDKIAKLFLATESVTKVTLDALKKRQKVTELILFELLKETPL